MTLFILCAALSRSPPLILQVRLTELTLASPPLRAHPDFWTRLTHEVLRLYGFKDATLNKFILGRRGGASSSQLLQDQLDTRAAAAANVKYMP